MYGFDKFSTDLVGMPELNLLHPYKIRIFCSAYELTLNKFLSKILQQNGISMKLIISFIIVVLNPI